MRPRIAAFVMGAAGAAFVACIDLFHSTSDVLTACALDASTPGCFDAAASSPQAETDFCAWTPEEARAHAQYACAWLGACETPMGGNAFGACMFRALLAYDCQANPNHRVKGKPLSLWNCLWQVKSCSDVDSCIFPAGPAECEPGTSYTACGIGGDGMAPSSDVLFACGGAPSHPNAYGENCALWGQTCLSNGTAAFCGGMAGLACGDAKACLGHPRSQLQWCVDGSDTGLDCAGNGGQFCVGFADASSPWLACAVESDAGPCIPDPSAICVNGVAVSCPTGTVETTDCASVLQSDAGCQPGPLAPPFDWTSPCNLAASACVESCSGDSLAACARGATFVVNCEAEGLGDCHLLTTDTDSAPRAACAPR
jgi:hypothetical protein